MTQLLYDGRKALPVDLLMGDTGWTATGSDEPLSDDVRRFYEYVGLLYRCTHIRADSLSKVPWAIVNSREETVWEKGKAPPADLMWLKRLPRLLHKSEAALALASQAYWHKERNRVKVTGLRWFAPIATAPYWDVQLGLTHFVRNTGTGLVNFPPDEIVYLRYEHPLHETLRDRSPAEAAMKAAGVLYNVDAFVSAFFERGAIKATLLTVKGNPPKEERERLKAWWNRVFTGVKNAFKTEVVSADSVAPVVVGEGISELSNTDLTGEKRSDVAITMGVPLSMVFSDAANYATAEQDEKNFYNSTIVPDCDLIAEQVNEQLLEDMGLRLVFKPQAMDIYQTDENERAQSFATYIGAGLPASLTAEMLGLELPDGWTYEDLDDGEDPEEPEQPVGQSDGAQPLDAEGLRPAKDDEEEDPAKASEIRRFKAWARRRKDPDPDAFHSRLLSHAEKSAILNELNRLRPAPLGAAGAREGGGAGQDFFRRGRALTLPAGPITPNAYKALLLQLDPDDDEAEQQIRVELERRLERKLSAAFQEQLGELLPEGASDDMIRATPGQVEATSQPVREVLRRELEQSASLGVTVAFDTLERIGIGFDWTLANTDAAKWASTYSFELVRGINSTTAQRLQVAVDDWFRERTTIGDLIDELKPTFGKQRARTIARTEPTRAAAEGTLAGWKAAGYGDERPSQIPPAHPVCRCWIVLRINNDGSAEFIWKTAHDERRCDICKDLHGKSLGFARRATNVA